MTSEMNNRDTQPNDHARIDALLRQWHDENRETAARKRDAIFAALAGERSRETDKRQIAQPSILWSFLMNRYTRIAASIIVLVGIAAFLFPPLGERSAHADGGLVMLPEGGRLDAFDELGALIGPCPLQHTHVDVDVSGHFARVTATQRYRNTYDSKIEAVYTFPLSHRAAVDRMTMTIGDRVVVGEVKERERARQIYESARAQGYVASLLEQERPNIFTQSVANIEPGAEVLIEISYVEALQSRDGEYRFDFPMVVAPRYIPGYPTSGKVDLPGALKPRRGVIQLGPAKFEADLLASGNILASAVQRATPIHQPPQSWWEVEDEANPPQVLYQFSATYADGSQEFGWIFDRGIGQLNGRWFHFDPQLLDVSAGAPGGAFSPDTDQVPDASKITPMPVRPDMRAGHTISVTVNIDTGGPGIVELNSPQHEIAGDEFLNRLGKPAPKATITLAAEDEIPNRDFLLTWKTTSDTIEEAIFTHTSVPGEHGEFAGGFFTFIMNPPDRVEDDQVLPREIIFVLDSSGSMSGFSIEAAKKVINKAIDTMRPGDRFNVISFNNTTDVLWDEPRANSPENREAAQRYIDSRTGGGGTEMRSAILKALEDEGVQGMRSGKPSVLTPIELANLPADGRTVDVKIDINSLGFRGQDDYVLYAENNIEIDVLPPLGMMEVIHDAGIAMISGHWLVPTDRVIIFTLSGQWRTQDGRRVFVVDEISYDDGMRSQPDPMRIVLFVTDGQVGNDDAIIQAIRENAKKTRVFTVGMGRSPNRHLLDEMAITGRGAADYALPDEDVDPIVARFAQRLATPVLADIEIAFDGFEVEDVITPGLPRATLDLLPDLYDAQPLVIHGRYQPGAKPKRGTLTIRGRTGEGPYERVIDLALPAAQPAHDVIATLWARSKVGELSRETAGRDVDPAPIVALGEAFGIVTEHTSFVAVEKSRIAIGGKPMLVRVPIEMPKDMSWEGIFGRLFVPIMRADSDLVEEVREKGIDAMVTRVRGLQQQKRYNDALEVADAILEVDPNVPAALLARDMLGTIHLHTRYREVERRREPRTAVDQILTDELAAELGAQYFAVRQLNSGNENPQPKQSGRISFAWQSGTRSDGPGRQLRIEAGRVRGVASSAERPAAPPPPPSPPPPSDPSVKYIAPPASETDAGSPLLGDIPVVGRVFHVTSGEQAAGGHARGGGGGGGGLFGDPGEDPDRSTSALMSYPEKWEQLSHRRVYEGASDAVDSLEVRQQMAHATIPLDLANNTLEETFDFLQQVSGIDVFIDWAELERIGIKRDDRITLQLGELPLDAALPRILEGLGDKGNPAQFAVHDGVLVISSGRRLKHGEAPIEEHSEQTIFVRVHDEDRLFEVGELIQGLNQWDVWEDMGGWLRLRHEDGEWIIENLAPEENVEARTEADRIKEQAEDFILTYKPIFDGLAREQVRAMVPLGFDDSPERSSDARVTAVYDVHDLMELELRTLPPNREGKRMRVRARAEVLGEQLVDVVVETVDRIGWDILGGDTSTIRILDHWLFIRSTPAVHRRVEQLFDSLQVAASPDEQVANVGRVRNLHDGDTSETRVYDLIDLLHHALPRPEAVGLDTWLVSREKLIEEIATSIIERVDPVGWEWTGGSAGSMRAYAGLLIVANTPENHAGIERTLRLMRLQLGLLSGDEREQAMVEAQAEVEFARRLDERLRLMMINDPDEDVLVAVLLEDLAGPTLDRLRGGGLAIEDRSERGPFVVGSINVAHLERMTMLDGVRRVELVE